MEIVEIITHEEDDLEPRGLFVTDQQVDWGDVGPEPMDGEGVSTAPDPTRGQQSSYTQAVQYPEAPANPHEHPYTITMKGGNGYDAPWVVIHASTASECIAKLNELEVYGFYPALGTANTALAAVTRQILQASAPPPSPAPAQAPAQGPPGTAPPFGPNVSVPNAPGYQGGFPQQQQYAGPPQGQSNSGPQVKPRPAGWAQCDVPWADKDRFKNLRMQNTETGNYLRGKIQWGGGGLYWIEPSVARWLAEQNFPVQQ